MTEELGILSDATEDAIDREEFFNELYWAHQRGECEYDCPYCEKEEAHED